MRKILLIMTTLLIFVLSGCSSDIKELQGNIVTINNEVKRTVSLYEDSLGVAKSLDADVESILNSQNFLPETDKIGEDLNPHLESLYQFYKTYAEEVEGYDFMITDKESEEDIVEVRSQAEELGYYTDVRYYYDDVSNILEQMYITTLPNGNTFMISLEWYKGELIKHEEMVSY